VVVLVVDMFLSFAGGARIKAVATEVCSDTAFSYIDCVSVFVAAIAPVREIVERGEVVRHRMAPPANKERCRD
jgi:hypothetical protein